MIDKKFSWVATHQKITEYLSTRENQQKELIELLKSVGISPFNDKESEDGFNTELEEIDPFTFYCYIYKYGSEKRLDFLQKIAQKIGIEPPNGDAGLPTAQAQKVWLFSYKYIRTDKDIPTLWAFFKKALSDNISDEDFKNVLKIKNTGRTKITEALFYINPYKYFPINGPSKPYLKKVLGIDPYFNTYTEYITLLKQIKEKIDVPFFELSYKAWKWNNEQKEINYWIFQGNPKHFDVVSALKAEELETWSVKAHKKKIKMGDKVILWVTGSKPGCYALATITSDILPIKERPDETQHYASEDSIVVDDKVRIQIDYNLATRPILAEDIKGFESLSYLKVGNQGTNFSATKREYKTFVTLAENPPSKQYWLYSPGSNAKYFDEFYQLGIMAIGWDELGDLNEYNTRDKIEAAFQKISPDKNRSNDIVANIEFKHFINIGDIIIVKRGRKEFLGYGVVTSDYYYDASRPYFQKCRKVDWRKSSIWRRDNGQNITKTLTDITPYPNFVAELVKLLGIEATHQASPKHQVMNLAKNTILYGPPGTGKTYFLKNNLMELFTSKEDSISKDEFIKSIIQECSWWQVIGLVLLELGRSKVADIANHPYLQIKLNASNTKTVTQNIWSQLQSHTIEECPNVKIKRRMTPLFFYKTEDSSWKISMKDLEEQASDLLDIKAKIDNFEQLPKKEIKRYDFLTFHQSYAYEDFIEGIKPELSDSDVAYTIEEGVFQKMCNRARSDSNNNYAIFIDEINRGNISAIFGELITLIEDDKREGEPNEIRATLPYSKNSFSVPSNLYIIGTMNTADRSVEALDTALRRRFAFIEMNPAPEQLNLPEFKCNGIDLAKMLLAINSRIEKLLDKDYCIGHSYFMTIKNRSNPLAELKEIFRNKILPLLQEYFYGDWGKIMLIIGEEFVSKKVETVNFLATKSYDDVEEYMDKPIYSFTDTASWTLASFQAIYE